MSHEKKINNCVHIETAHVHCIGVTFLVPSSISLVLQDLCLNYIAVIFVFFSQKN